MHASLLQLILHAPLLQVTLHAPLLQVTLHVPLLQATLHAPWLLPILLYIIPLSIQFGDSTTYKFVLYNLSKVMFSVNFLKFLLYLLSRISLLMGRFSVRSIAAFSPSISRSTISQPYIVRSVVCSAFVLEHVRLSVCSEKRTDLSETQFKICPFL